MKTPSHEQPRGMERSSLRTLFILGHVPLYFFAVGIAVVSFGVLAVVDDEVRRVTAIAGQTVSEQLAISEMGSAFSKVWLWSLGAFFLFVGLGSALVAWTHRILGRRIDRIVTHARRIGVGMVDVPIAIEADDALGTLEEALGQVATALAKRDAARHSDQEAREVDAQVQRALAMIESEADAHRVVRRALQRLLPDEAAHLMMADSSQAHLRVALTTGKAASVSCGVEAPALCPAVQRGSSLTFPDSDAIDACPRLAGRDTACSTACLPVTVMGRATGILQMIRPVHQRFANRELSRLDALASALGSRTGTLRTLETTQLQAGTDPLTGLLNRRSLESKATAMLIGAQRLSVVMADLDHFKHLNDTYGHAAGDRALRAFAQTLRTTLRPSDALARWGGEEFCLVVDDCKGSDVRIALDRVRLNLARQGGEGVVPACTVSFGVAEFPRDGLELEHLIEAADGALYQAKQQGRDRVVLCGETGNASQMDTSAT